MRQISLTDYFCKGLKQHMKESDTGYRRFRRRAAEIDKGRLKTPLRDFRTASKLSLTERRTLTMHYRISTAVQKARLLND